MKKKKILVVDDDKDTQLLLKKRLEANGFDYYSSLSVEDAIRIFSKVDLDVVILDLMFQGPNGTAFLQYVKNHPSQTDQTKKKTPILIISGCNEKEVIDYVMDHGASGFIKKPIDAKHLISVIQEYLEEA